MIRCVVRKGLVLVALDITNLINKVPIKCLNCRDDLQTLFYLCDNCLILYVRERTTQNGNFKLIDEQTGRNVTFNYNNGVVSIIARELDL